MQSTVKARRCLFSICSRPARSAPRALPACLRHLSQGDRYTAGNRRRAIAAPRRSRIRRLLGRGDVSEAGLDTGKKAAELMFSFTLIRSRRSRKPGRREVHDASERNAVWNSFSSFHLPTGGGMSHPSPHTDDHRICTRPSSARWRAMRSRCCFDLRDSFRDEFGEGVHKVLAFRGAAAATSPWKLKTGQSRSTLPAAARAGKRLLDQVGERYRAREDKGAREHPPRDRLTITRGRFWRLESGELCGSASGLKPCGPTRRRATWRRFGTSCSDC